MVHQTWSTTQKRARALPTNSNHSGSFRDESSWDDEFSSSLDDDSMATGTGQCPKEAHSTNKTLGFLDWHFHNVVDSDSAFVK